MNGVQPLAVTIRIPKILHGRVATGGDIEMSPAVGSPSNPGRSSNLGGDHVRRGTGDQRSIAGTEGTGRDRQGENAEERSGGTDGEAGEGAVVGRQQGAGWEPCEKGEIMSGEDPEHQERPEEYRSKTCILLVLEKASFARSSILSLRGLESFQLTGQIRPWRNNCVANSQRVRGSLWTIRWNGTYGRRDTNGGTTDNSYPVGRKSRGRRSSGRKNGGT
ncbi:hypothetical protein BT96DRAFT_949139 [Gymnopus androsaceus JB14]|uniref:Uncharacterized protein n=1 Tax=Gymnopus androsaceus JB14 TaxID=1447944 RepID=A0A6A4GM81_9AGAR|nr:hypothetical protein BT96DRAFT_949139 [Gymnopus androsaceus JB14]